MSEATKTVRRSVALPGKLVDEVAAVAPPELQGNFNRLVTVALWEFVARRKRQQFERMLDEMAADPDIRRESEAILRDFAVAEGDGLEGL